MLNLLTKFVGGILRFLIAIVIVIPMTLGFSHAQSRNTDQDSAAEERGSIHPPPPPPALDQPPVPEKLMTHRRPPPDDDR